MRTFSVVESVYKTDTLFVIGWPWAKFAAMMKRDYGATMTEGGVGGMFTLTHDSRPPFRCIWAERAEWEIVAHEIVHLCTRILGDRGVKFSAKNDEALAYLIEFYVHVVQERVGGRMNSKGGKPCASIRTSSGASKRPAGRRRRASRRPASTRRKGAKAVNQNRQKNARPGATGKWTNTTKMREKRDAARRRAKKARSRNRG